MQRLPVPHQGGPSIQSICSRHSVQRGIGVHQVELCPKRLVWISQQGLRAISTPAGEASFWGWSDRGMRSQVRMTAVEQGRSISTAVSARVWVSHFWQIQVFSVAKLKRIKKKKKSTDIWGMVERKSQRAARQVEGHRYTRRGTEAEERLINMCKVHWAKKVPTRQTTKDSQCFCMRTLGKLAPGN